MKLRLNRLFKRRPRSLRAPIPGFDADYYLASYPDVHRMGFDPLRHYLDQGWKEGRDPSAGFSTSGYLAANPDVAEAGLNPLLHFVSIGLAEGRGGFAKDPRSAAPYPCRQLEPPQTAARTEFKMLQESLDSERMKLSRPPQGHVDEFFHDVAQGWVLGAVSPNSVAEVEIFLDGTLIGTALGDVFRPDIKQLGFGDGRHGFKFEFKPPLNPFIDHVIVVRRAVDKLVIGQVDLLRR